MRETQETISRWAEETFGPVGSNLSVAVRANQEMAELLYVLAADERSPQAVEEAADVVIVLLRLADRIGHQARLKPFVLDIEQLAPPKVFAFEANGEMARIMDDLRAGWHAPITGLQRVICGMFSLAQSFGIDLGEAIDRKMEINRARQWRLDGNGHGYHVKVSHSSEKPPSSAP